MIFRFGLRGSSPEALAVAIALCPLSVLGCSGGGGDGTASNPPACLETAANLACAPAYGLTASGDVAPTFDQLWSRTLRPTCGVSGCHAAPHPQNGFELDDQALAYDALLAHSTAGTPRVTPGDVRCGAVIVRLEQGDEPWSMPPGQHLDEPTLCVIRHWIANGAPR
jgi:hypothetical protein